MYSIKILVGKWVEVTTLKQQQQKKNDRETHLKQQQQKRVLIYFPFIELKKYQKLTR